ncbi:hypothetical protein TRFO_08754 [Tritrichomonas foetus]|uniref:Ankyrin repeat protein n=1 Tax=Tritrichomonas foetus TaxID=1144522 RepID=A0A1J4JHZ8_9EUKA|nr:hypothetical protein TRFO_08754 [Tritrichomonas foetus]|eukprot:OHS98742.1 hypothetical protein TRFO_08754 [Tritrichomonas foetus]
MACFYNDRNDKEDSKYELIKYLLDNTTNIEPRVSNTQGPAQWICKSKSPDIARLFFEKKGDQIDVHRVDQLGYLGPSYLSFFKSNQSDIIDILKIFRQHGFDFNYYNIQTNTPSILESFILAIDKLHNVIKWLLENGANPNVPFVRGNGQFSTLLEKALATYSISHHFKSYQSNK